MKNLLSLLFICSALNLYAAREPVKGLVLDAETKEPLPFTNIRVEGKSRGTVSNGEGYFILDLEGVGAEDLLVFSFIGYESYKIKAGELQHEATIYLKAAAVSLNELQVFSTSLSAAEIMARVRERFPENYPMPTHKQRIYFHKYEKTPFPKTNKIILKKSDFVGLDKKAFDELYSNLPTEFISYQDVLLQLYSNGGGQKLLPIEAISLEEGSHQALVKEIEKELGAFFEDIEKTKRKQDVYYKFRTGIVGMKVEEGREEEPIEEEAQDSLSFQLKTADVKSNILFLLREYAHLESENWEFIHENKKYHHVLESTTSYHNEPVYEISFRPRKKGLFKGRMYISSRSFAILQLDFAYAEGKQTENFQMLGVGHAMNFKMGRVIFEKGADGYFVKYIYARQHEMASVDRKFSIMKKKKRFLFDKTLNKIKLEAQLIWEAETSWELLVLDREKITPQEFEEVQQPPTIKFRKEYANNPEMWEKGTVIAPSSDLKKYERP